MCFFAAKQVWLDVYKEFVQIFLSKELGKVAKEN